MGKNKILVLILTFIVGIFYQPRWVYYNFYYNPKWVDESWWALNFWVYLILYASISVGFVAVLIKLTKKYL